MAKWSLAALIAELEAAIFAMPKAVRALLGPARATAPEGRLTQFGEYERVEESKFSPPPAPDVEEGELPESYGRTRLVMLAASPYRVHAYWEVTPDALAEAQRKLEDQSGPASAVLRFHEAASANGAGGGSAGWFDIEVDLQARNWYVQLWSADRTYRVDLGLRAGGGRFVKLAGSNPVSTPRAWPKAELEEHFVRVGAEPQFAEAVAPPAFVKPVRPKPEIRLAPAAVERPAAAPPREEMEAPAETFLPAQADALATLERKLTELYALRESPVEPPRTVEPPGTVEPPRTVEPPAGAVSPEHFVAPLADLTEIAEQKFLPGVSSASAQRPHEGQ
jgi:hypothetical protein